MNEKLAHVRASVSQAAKQGHRPHRCHAIGCNKQIPPAFFMCSADWKLVPKALQRQVWEHYNIGQEEGAADVTPAYLDVTEAAIKAVQAAKGKTR